MLPCPGRQHLCSSLLMLCGRFPGPWDTLELVPDHMNTFCAGAHANSGNINALILPGLNSSGLIFTAFVLQPAKESSVRSSSAGIWSKMRARAGSWEEAQARAPGHKKD